MFIHKVDAHVGSGVCGSTNNSFASRDAYLWQPVRANRAVQAYVPVRQLVWRDGHPQCWSRKSTSYIRHQYAVGFKFLVYYQGPICNCFRPFLKGYYFISENCYNSYYYTSDRNVGSWLVDVAFNICLCYLPYTNSGKHSPSRPICDEVHYGSKCCCFIVYKLTMCIYLYDLWYSKINCVLWAR